ncbi:MAG: D-hexose-6-phosphate mutarotase [Oleiphilaceae bacterium]|nr:D-hexose-6-phosphate mutarotase [Oleiphilaceae bacterium]
MTTTPGHWSFTRWTTVGQLEAIEVHHPLFRARLFLQGAHLTRFAPNGEANWLWVSDAAHYETGRAIRGGIPVCWPWFGEPTRNPPEVRRRIRTETAHGFARTAVWQLEDVRESAHDVEINLSLDANQDFNEVWQGHARALLTFRFSSLGCQLALTTVNAGPDILAFTQALHSYFPTQDITTTEIQGLEGISFLDTLDDWRPKLQKGPVRFFGETDRIYEAGQPLLAINAQSSRARSSARSLSCSGSDSTVIWNPGPAKAKTLSDFPDAAWREMFCVETANAGNDYQVLDTGQSHTLAMMLRHG